MTTFFIIMCVLYVYFFPTILAIILGHANARGVAFVNLLLGWTILGWFLTCIWAVDIIRDLGKGHESGPAAKESI